MPILYAVFVDGHFWRAYTHRITAEMTALGFHGRGEVVAYSVEVAVPVSSG